MKLYRWSSLRRLYSSGQGVFGVGGVPVTGSPSSAKGMLSCKAWTTEAAGSGGGSTGGLSKAGRGTCVCGEE